MESPHIAIIDDSLDTCLLLQAYLTKGGYQNVSYVRSAEEGIELLKRFNVDLVLLDILMPAMDGIEAIIHFRNLPKYESLPIIMVSAAEHSHYLEKAFEIGANDYISKPVDATELLYSIKKALR